MALPKPSFAIGAVFLVVGVAIGYFAALHTKPQDDPLSVQAPTFTASTSDPSATSVSIQIGTQTPVPVTAEVPVSAVIPAVPTPVSASSAAPIVSGAASGLQSYFASLNDTNASVYVVKAGDNLTKISQSQGVTVGQILAASGLSDPNKLQVGMKLKIMKDKWDVLVDKSTYTLYLRAAGKTVQTYRIGLGKDNSTPVGSFKIVNRLKNPTWYHEGVVAPYGDPKNPLGTRWMGFDIKGYGLHGTIEPASIGKSESMGCVRMLNEEVEALYELLPVGTPVTIAEKLVTA